MSRVVTAALCVAAACGTPSRPAAPDPLAAARVDLAAAIDAGDQPRAMRALCAAYADAGVPCAATLALESIAADDVMSRYTELHTVRLQPAPRDGRAYWDNWRGVLGPSFEPPAVDEPIARRLANLLLATVLAHEIGHHLAERFSCNPGDAASRELLADELSVPVWHALLAPADIAALARVTDAMIAAVPAAPLVPATGDLHAWARGLALPQAPDAYAALHLARQRRVAADPPPGAAAACVAADRARLAGRVLANAGRVTTMAPLPDVAGNVVAIAPDGAVWAVDMFGGATPEVRRLDGGGPPRALALLGDVMPFAALAVGPERRLALGDTARVWLVDGSDIVREVLVAPGRRIQRLAFDARGELYASYYAMPDDEHLRIGPLDGPARWTIASDTDRAWHDGPAARGTPGAFAIDGDRVVFYDRVRDAVRALARDGSVVTIAGSRPGRRDGSVAEAELFDVVAIAKVGDRVLAVEEARSSVVRAIAP